MVRSKDTEGRGHVVVKTDGIKLRKDWTGTNFGFNRVKKHVGYNYLGRAVFLCIDIFGEEFFCSGRSFGLKGTNNFKERVWPRSSKQKVKKLRHCYYNMLKRCYSPDSLTSKYYYGEGVKVCNEWLGPEGLYNFIVWAASAGYQLGLTIDKKDKLYSPATCRWITQLENSRYTRRTLLDEEKVKEIRESFAHFDGLKNDFYKLKAIQYAVAADTIRYVISGKRWIGV